MSGNAVKSRGKAIRRGVSGPARWLLPFALVYILSFSGCSSGSNVKAGPISVIDPAGRTAGQLSSLSAGSVAQVNMTPTGDKADAGVNWTVTCGGSPVTGSITGGACGTFVPTHTPDGVASLFTAPSIVPIGNTVTITADVASNPSATSSITLPIVAPALSLSFVSPPTPTTVDLGEKANFQVSLLNGTAADKIQWTGTCGSSPCGSFSQTVTSGGSVNYIAPATMPSSGNTIQITATLQSNTTVSASTTLTILPVSIGITPTTYNVQTQGAASFTATLTNDYLAQGAKWSLSCNSTSPQGCGSLSSSQTGQQASPTAVPYTAPVTYSAPSAIPSGGTVTITATSVTQPTQSATAIVNITADAPITVAWTAMPLLTLSAGSSTTLTAKVTNDANPPYGVNWAVSCGNAGNANCGTFSAISAPGSGSSYTVSATYNAPTTSPADGGVVTITASSAAPATTLTNLATATISITTIAWTAQPPASVVAGTTAQVGAAVNQPGGVTWTACNNNTPQTCNASQTCGWFTNVTQSGTAAYHAPPVIAASTTVTITATATSTSNSVTPASVSSTVAITPAPLSIAFVGPVPSQMQPAATVNLNAAVSNDNQNEGVDWQLCASNCGYFTIKPATPAIPATAKTPFVPAVPAVTAIFAQAWPNGLPIPYTAPVTLLSGNTVTVTAAAHADPTISTQATTTIATGGTGPALNGTAMAGTQPVVGAQVQLLEAGTTGYASAATALVAPSSTSSVVTDSDGNFTIPAGYSCAQPTSQVYVVAIGGSVGTNAPNSDLAMMTALGPCGNLNSLTFIVNEVTTVASAWPLAPFASNDPLTGNSSYYYLGSSSSNTAGLADAFATVNNLVDISTGQARYLVPAGNAAVPYAEIDTLADILNACTSTSGGSEGDGSACGALLANSDPLGNNELLQSTPPKDTLQAAFNIAQHPGNGFGYNIASGNVSYLFNSSISFSSPFQPILSAGPNDWSISLNFTGGGGLSSSSVAQYFAVDSSDNLWITDSNAASIIEWNNQGAAISPSSGFPAGGGPMAIDASGNIWISRNNTLTELTNLGAAYPWSPYTGVAGGGTAIAFDAAGNLWIGNGGSVAEFNNLGVELSPTAGYVNSGVTGIGPVAVDSSDNVWVGGATAAELSDISGQLIVAATDAGAAVDAGGILQIAADGSGRVWVPSPAGESNAFCAPQPANTAQLYQANCKTKDSFQLIYNAQGIAVDGAGWVWIANAGGFSSLEGVQVAPNLTEIDPSNLSNPANAQADFQSSSLSNGPEQVAVDRAGNVWVLLANDTVTEYVGVATPAVTTIALAVKNKKLGAKP